VIWSAHPEKIQISSSPHRDRPCQPVPRPAIIGSHSSRAWSCCRAGRGAGPEMLIYTGGHELAACGRSRVIAVTLLRSAVPFHRLGPGTQPEASGPAHGPERRPSRHPPSLPCREGRQPPAASRHRKLATSSHTGAEAPIRGRLWNCQAILAVMSLNALYAAGPANRAAEDGRQHIWPVPGNRARDGESGAAGYDSGAAGYGHGLSHASEWIIK